MMQINYRPGVRGFAVWHVGEPFLIQRNSVHLVERVHLDGDELTYADDLVNRQDGRLPHGRVVTLTGEPARALVRLIMDDLAANPPPARVAPIPQHETQQSISQWANDTFGPLTTNVRAAVRANEEMAELLRELAMDDTSPKAAAEIADVFIVLYRLADRMGVDVQAEIDRKMAINRDRQWVRDGSGHAYHVKA
jgi:NTP pyrophosphatase (non-canonical NTP hydrolase)